MGVDVQQNKARVLRLVPQAPMSAPTCRIVDRYGEELDTPTATPHEGDTTVVSATDAQNLEVVDATDFAAGHTVRVTDAQWGSATSVISAVDGNSIRLVEPLPDVPRYGSAVRGLDVSVSITTTATETLGLDFMVIVETDDEEVTELFNVVAHPYRGPVTARIVRDYMARLWQGESTEDETWYGRVADEVNSRVRGRLLESSAYISRYWDPDALREIGSLMMKLVLADYGFWSSDTDREDYLRSIRIEMKERVAGVLKGGAAYDEDGDGEMSDDELDGSTTIRGVR